MGHRKKKERKERGELGWLKISAREKSWRLKILSYF
jgi:hypothetical protein